jgi:ADP-heptose:LPS heptosyltransferase
LLKALDPLVLHLTETFLGRRSGQSALSFGASLDGTRDILLVAARELTDLLAVVPAARALRKRYRLARVHVLASPVCAEVLATRPEVFEAVPWNADEPLLSRGTLRRLRDLRGRGFDLAVAIDGGGARRERVIGALSGAKLRLGMHPEGADATLNLVVAVPASTGYRPVQSLEFLSFLGIPREQLTPCWEIPEADRAYAQRLLDLRRKDSRGWLLGVDPGVGRGGVRPHPAKLAWLVERLVTSRGALPIVLTDDPSGDCVAELKSHLRVPVLEPPSRGVRDVLSFLGCCELFLSGNTNLFHFGVALGTPSIAFFGREEDERWVPQDRLAARVVRWSPGERVRESDFLAAADAVREAGSGVPSGVGEPEEAPERESGHSHAVVVEMPAPEERTGTADRSAASRS